MTGLPTGTYRLEVFGADALVSDPFDVAPNLLWDRTWELVGINQLERRSHLARSRKGWQDCGGGWQEANSHTAMIIGLCDLYDYASRFLDRPQIDRLIGQIVRGSEYLNLLQDCAAERGLGDGCLSHQAFTYEDVVLPQDAAQAVVAWLRAAAALGGESPEVAAAYRERARRASAWLDQTSPLSPTGISKINHGIDSSQKAPAEWMTRDLLLHLWGESLLNGSAPTQKTKGLIDKIVGRQIKHGDGNRLFGHFKTFDSLDVAEKAWIHNMEDSEFGADLAGHFPHYVLPLLGLVKANPNSTDSAICRDAVRDFAYGYFLPACKANPFGILPLGDFGDEGLLWFAGLWHGMNGAYGLAAVLALEFSRYFDDPAFMPIAVGNLQWIAGLNAGLTADGMYAAHMYSTDLPLGKAIPHSMIYGIGNRFSGSWMTVRGSIANGFSTGDQFKFDVKPTRANDGPHSYTDEDWITHAGGWISAIARLRSMNG
jgi:hypothetical protein